MNDQQATDRLHRERTGMAFVSGAIWLAAMAGGLYATFDAIATIQSGRTLDGLLMALIALGAFALAYRLLRRTLR